MKRPLAPSPLPPPPDGGPLQDTSMSPTSMDGSPIQAAMGPDVTMGSLNSLVSDGSAEKRVRVDTGYEGSGKSAGGDVEMSTASPTTPGTHNGSSLHAEGFDRLDAPATSNSNSIPPTPTPSNSNPSTNAFQVLMSSPTTHLRNLASQAPPLIAAPTPILDRYSKFVAHTTRVRSPRDVERVIAAVNLHPDLQRATHKIRAFRYLRLKPGFSNSDVERAISRSSAGGGVVDPLSMWDIIEGFDDDGEQWAGEKLLKLLKAHGVCDCMVVVTRWFGGTQLGPVRFKHIENVALAALVQAGYVKGASQQAIGVPPNNGSAPAIPNQKTTSDGLLSATSTPSQPAENPDIQRLLRILKARDLTLQTWETKLHKSLNEHRENSQILKKLKSRLSDNMDTSPTSKTPSSSGPPLPVGGYDKMPKLELERLIGEKDKRILDVKDKMSKVMDLIAAQRVEMDNLALKVAVEFKPAD
ncbi:hypothetical protein HDV05_001028 [Chytridiales sp. JEL 0842]|nr:hypothetical protein HDV05_001028 [Chytridiales sp. JEL 0842]